MRRPPPQAFNGVVVVEWINVTGGPDKDIDWWQSGEHLMRSGYAYVAVSAQQMGIDTMADWGSVRYGGLDMTADGTVDNDALSFDAFSAVGRVILRRGEESGPGTADILDGLRAEQIVATGHSQSAARLAAYINSIHPLEPIFDGFMVHGGGGLIRDDQPVKIFKLMAETDMRGRAAEPSPIRIILGSGRWRTVPMLTCHSKLNTQRREFNGGPTAGKCAAPEPTVNCRLTVRSRLGM